MEKEIKFVYEELSFDELSAEERILVEDVFETSKHTSYAPYSQFSVAAALLLDNGAIVRGTNQENASYPCGICAERVALSSAAVQYNRPVKILAIAARTPDKQLTESPVTPCGMCRQVMIETEKRYGSSMEVLLCSKNRFYRIKGAAALLPLQFDL